MGGMLVYCRCCNTDPDRLLEPPADNAFLVQIDQQRAYDPQLRFPLNGWDADFYGLAILAEFVQRPEYQGINIGPPPANDSAETAQEIQELIQFAQNERRIRLPEIVRQDCYYLEEMMRFVMMGTGTHPMTMTLIKGAARVSELLMSDFKARHNRPRPQQLEPILVPPIASHHPAYPSGHATQSHLIARCLGQLIPQYLRAGLLAIATRVARNREVASLHYPSDGVAGRSLADQAYDVLQACDRYRQVRAAAASEWP